MANPTTKPALPERNPKTVRVTCPIQSEIHGWTVGAEYPVTDPSIGSRDDNGYDIRIQSVKYNRPVWLSSIEYEPVTN